MDIFQNQPTVNGESPAPIKQLVRLQIGKGCQAQNAATASAIAASGKLPAKHRDSDFIVAMDRRFTKALYEGQQHGGDATGHRTWA